ncbi:MAG: aldehyde ferredoxin oxidoreductase family protein [Candidatus Lokiarchaeota archaeon]|jgi:aldehyde:ferredoxin oxidoreductase
MKFGYMNRILRINLTTEKITTESLNEIILRRYVGGQGFIAYLLLKDLAPKINALSSKNLLIFATGPLTGTRIPGSGRNCVGAKSPLTGGFGEADVGGYWGAELKHAGYDALIIEGKAKNPIYLYIRDDNVQIQDAEKIWGKDTGFTEQVLKKELNDKLIRVAQIGIGGENLVLYACIINDLRNAAGRTGMGAVMGSKNLKAIAIRGSRKPKIANNYALREILKNHSKNFIKTSRYFSLGTGGGLMESFAIIGNLPVKNFRDGGFFEAKALDPKILKERYGLNRGTCYACPIRCKKIVNFNEPYSVDSVYGGPEYETIAAFGSNCGITDIKVVSKANELCNRYSIDTISTGVCISFAMECYENDLLSDQDLNGLQLNFGNGNAMLRLIEMIAHRKKIGDILANGVLKASESIGNNSFQYAIHVKGQEVPMHEPRLKQGLGLGYMVSPTGAEHMINLHDTSINTKETMENFAPFGLYEPLKLTDLSPKKVRAVMYISNWRVVENCLMLCFFSPYTINSESNLLNVVTGWNSSVWELMKLGERITTMAKIFNIREGFTKEDDWLPGRFYQPHTSGSLVNTKIDPIKIQDARESYYKMMGWDIEGVPKQSKLEELDIGWTFKLIS